MNFEITKAGKVKVHKVEWLWYPFIPFGKVTVIQGEYDISSSQDEIIIQEKYDLIGTLAREEHNPSLS